MKFFDSEMIHKITYNTFLVLFITLFSLVVSAILYYVSLFISNYFDWNIHLNYFIYWGIVESILGIYFVVALKEGRDSQSEAARHHEDTNWMNSHIDKDYWDPPTDYYEND
jgi:hypothetical protein